MITVSFKILIINIKFLKYIIRLQGELITCKILVKLGVFINYPYTFLFN